MWKRYRRHKILDSALRPSRILTIGNQGLLTFSWARARHDLPGSGGQRPPRVSPAIAISASGLRKPYARRVSSRRWVLVASERALDRPCSTALRIRAWYLLMVLASWPNGSRRHRRGPAVPPPPHPPASPPPPAPENAPPCSLGREGPRGPP